MGSRSPAPKATLLRVAHADEDWRRGLDSWRAPPDTHGPVFDCTGQVQAAADGVGIAMASDLIDDDLQAGRLVAPFSLTLRKGALVSSTATSAGSA